MRRERFRWLAGLIAAHEDCKVVGRTRLQKTIKLLQRRGFPTDYQFALFFYGPYSDGINVEVRLLEQMKYVTEERNVGNAGQEYYILRAQPEAALPEGEMQPWLPMIRKTEQAGAVPLELAATYDMFREMGDDHTRALTRLRFKKGTKCDGGNQETALGLLAELGLPHD